MDAGRKDWSCWKNGTGHHFLHRRRRGQPEEHCQRDAGLWLRHSSVDATDQKAFKVRLIPGHKPEMVSKTVFSKQLATHLCMTQPVGIFLPSDILAQLLGNTHLELLENGMTIYLLLFFRNVRRKLSRRPVQRESIKTVSKYDLQRARRKKYVWHDLMLNACVHTFMVSCVGGPKGHDPSQQEEKGKGRGRLDKTH